MNVSRIRNGFKLLITGIADMFRRKASFACLAVSCGALGFFGLFFFLSGLSESAAGFTAAGAALLAVTVGLLLLNTVFRAKNAAGSRGKAIQTEPGGAEIGPQSVPGSPDPRDARPLEADTVLDSIFVDGFSNGERVGIVEEYRYVHANRSLLRIGSGTGGVSRRDVLLSSLPEKIRTEGELIEYAKARGVRFWNR